MNGADLKTWRKEHRYTQQALSDELNVARQTVISWEKLEERLPRILVLALKSLEEECLVTGQRYTVQEYRTNRARLTEPRGNNSSRNDFTQGA